MISDTLKWLLLALMSVMIIAVFMTSSPMSEAKALVTGDVSVDPAKIYRIMYFHVPQAITATLAFMMAMAFALAYLAKRDIKYDIYSFRANQCGMLFAILALLTGIIFARYTWGFWWDWSEVRMTSMLVLTLMYGGYFALRSSIADRDKRAALSAVMSCLFTLAGVFLMFVVPRIAASRHPTDSIVDSSGSLTMSTNVGLIFFASVLSFIGLFIWIWRVSSRLSLLELKRERKSTAKSGVMPRIVEAPAAASPTAPAGGGAGGGAGS